MIPAFPPYLVRRATLGEFKVEPFEVELAAFQEIFPVGGQKVFYIKKEKNSDLSYDVRRFFSANESYHFFLLYLRFKRSCSDACFSVENFVRLKRRDGRDGTRQKSGSG